MRIKKRNIPKKALVLGIIVPTLIAISTGTFVYLYKFNGSILGWQPNPIKELSTINYDQPTEEQKKAGEEVKQSTATGDSKPPAESGESKLPAPSPQPSGKGKVDITITAANQNGATLQLRSNILAITSTGTCTLTLTKAGQVVTKTTGVQALSSSSTCQGFDIPTSELSPGTWTASLHFENNNLIAETTKTVTIQ